MRTIKPNVSLSAASRSAAGLPPPRMPHPSPRRNEACHLFWRALTLADQASLASLSCTVEKVGAYRGAGRAFGISAAAYMDEKRTDKREELAVTAEGQAGKAWPWCDVHVN